MSFNASNYGAGKSDGVWDEYGSRSRAISITLEFITNAKILSPTPDCIDFIIQRKDFKFYSHNEKYLLQNFKWKCS